MIALAILIVALNVVVRREGGVVDLLAEIGLTVVRVMTAVLGHSEYSI